MIVKVLKLLILAMLFSGFVAMTVLSCWNWDEQECKSHCIKRGADGYRYAENIHSGWGHCSCRYWSKEIK